MTKKTIVVVASKTAPASPEAGAVFGKGVHSLKFLSWKELKGYKPHPNNWKIHPPGQRNAINAATKAIGYADACVINDVTGHFLDGHMRAEEAIKNKEPRVPVLFGTWTAEEELVVLQSKDTIGASFNIDASALDSLTKIVQRQHKTLGEALKTTDAKTAVQRLTQGTAALAKKLLQGEEAGEAMYRPLPFNLPKPSRTRSFDDHTEQVGQTDAEETELDEETGGLPDAGVPTEEDEPAYHPSSLGQQERGYSGDAESDESGDSGSPELSPVFTVPRLRADVIFSPAKFLADDGEPYEDVYGIPELHPDVWSPERYVQPNDAPLPIVWDRTSKTMLPSAVYCYSAGPNFPPEKQGGFLSFHTDDHRFVGARNDVVKFVQKLERQEWKGLFEPEFSVTSALPAAVCLKNLYDSRFCARYWQECYLPIIPILRSWGWFETDPLYPCRLIQPGTPVVGCQARNMKKEERASKMRVLRSLFEYAVDAIESKVIVVYGGKDYEKYLVGNLYKPDKVEYVLTPSFMATRRDLIDENV